jgi:hypothetical protein
MKLPRPPSSFKQGATTDTAKQFLFRAVQVLFMAVN